ncbi:MAG: Hsp33 family molecular chaperone HslO, partial [Alphaproteobacteria bacterium]
GVQAQSGDHDDADETWRRAVVLLGSCTLDELVATDLHPHDLLFRLFNEDGVRVFEQTALQMRCRCSRQRVESVLRSFPRAEIETMKDGDDVVVTCEFCNATYRFDPAGIETLYADAEIC